MVYEKLRSIFPQVEEVPDILNGPKVLDQVQSTHSAMEHLTGAVRTWMGEGDDMDPVWKETLNWFLKQSPDGLAPLQEGVAFDNRVDQLERDLVDRIYKKEEYEMMVLSPSRLERFGRCPFNHFLQYGLRPQERRVFELAGRETGDVYHECLMRLSRELTTRGLEVTDPKSGWMTVSREQCQEQVSALMEEIADQYGEQVLRSGGREEYRLDRMKKICGDAAWILIQHVRQGQISDMYLEASFGRSRMSHFPPIEIPVKRKDDSGALVDETMLIEGKIDRVDVLPGNDGTKYVKIIDYKSGNEVFRPEEARGGYRLQLMLYLQGALEGVQGKDGDGQKAEPAGVFYFMIGEPSVNTEGISAQDLADKVTETVEKSFKMNGLMVDDPAVIRSVAGDFDKSSLVVPLSRKKDGTLSKTSEASILTASDFTEFREEVGEVIQDLCQQICDGEISPSPRKTKHVDACQYCDFKSVCYFDTAFSGCRPKK